MFWRLGIHQQSPIESLLERSGEKGEYKCSLEDLLREDDLLQELKAHNEGLIQFLVRPKIISQLFSYVTNPPYDGSTEERRLKFPYLSCEILCCQIDEMFDVIFSEPDLLQQLFAMLKLEAPLNSLLSSYFCRVVIALIGRKKDELLSFIYYDAGNELLQRFLHHLDNSHIVDLMLRLIFSGEVLEKVQIQILGENSNYDAALQSSESLIGSMSTLSYITDTSTLNALPNSNLGQSGNSSSVPKRPIPSKVEMIDRWVQAGLIESLLQNFQPHPDPDVHENVCTITSSIIYVMSRWSDHIRSQFYRESVLQRFIDQIVQNQQASLVIQGLNILIDLVKAETLPIKTDTKQPFFVSAPTAPVESGNLSLVIDIIARNFDSLTNLLFYPSASIFHNHAPPEEGDAPPIPTPLGVINAPFGRSRLKVAEFFVTLVEYVAKIDSFGSENWDENFPQLEEALRIGARLLESSFLAHEVIPQLLFSFMKYEWNSCLHKHVAQMTSVILNSRSEALTSDLIIRGALSSILVVCFAKNDEIFAASKFRAGFAGHVVNLAALLMSKAESNPQVKSLLSQSMCNVNDDSAARDESIPRISLDGWNCFYTQVILPRLTTQETALSNDDVSHLKRTEPPTDFLDRDDDMDISAHHGLDLNRDAEEDFLRKSHINESAAVEHAHVGLSVPAADEPPKFASAAAATKSAVTKQAGLDSDDSSSSSSSDNDDDDDDDDDDDEDNSSDSSDSDDDDDDDDDVDDDDDDDDEFTRPRARRNPSDSFDDAFNVRSADPKPLSSSSLDSSSGRIVPPSFDAFGNDDSFDAFGTASAGKVEWNSNTISFPSPSDDHWANFNDSSGFTSSPFPSDFVAEFPSTPQTSFSASTDSGDWAKFDDGFGDAASPTTSPTQ